MSDDTSKSRVRLFKFYRRVLDFLPLVAMLFTLGIWVDTRYMHKEISDIRFIELQIKILDGQIKDYHRIVDAGGRLTADEKVKYDSDLQQLRNLMSERNKILGIGDMP